MDYDLLIVGAGPAGLCFARAVAAPGLRLGIVERQPEPVLAAPGYDGREIALTHFSVRVLEQLGIWPRLAESAAPLRDACVWNGPSRYAMRLDHADSGREQLGFLVSNHLIRRAAYEVARGIEGLDWRLGVQVKGIHCDREGARLQLSDGTELGARLVVAADSRFSETRRAMGIPAAMHDFGKTMVLCRMSHELEHGETAREWFDYGQTVALLPLRDRRTSVIITLPDQQAQELLQMDDAAFTAEVERRLQQRLGRMQVDSGRHAYPLVGVYPERFVATRFATIGDAAVGMHPVTAHGFNFGLRSVDTLATGIREARGRGLDPAAPWLLARYDREHRLATRGLYLATQALVKLYTNDAPAARIARDLLLRLGNGLGPFKKTLVSTLAEEKAGGNPLVRALSALAAQRLPLGRAAGG